MMLNKSELLRLKALTKENPSDPLNFERISRIITSRIVDQGEQADSALFVADLLTDLTKRHSSSQDIAARQLYWGLMAALSALGERIIDEAPDN